MTKRQSYTRVFSDRPRQGHDRTDNWLRLDDSETMVEVTPGQFVNLKAAKALGYISDEDLVHAPAGDEAAGATERDKSDG